MNPSLTNILGDCAALLGVDSTADDVTDREALLVLRDLQLGVTCLVRDLLTVQVWHCHALLLRHWGTLGGFHSGAHILHYSNIINTMESLNIISHLQDCTAVPG